jgi:pyocin large subunit-like protein
VVPGTTTPSLNAYDHFRRHGADFPDVYNATQYVKKATDFLHNPPPTMLPFTRKSNVDIVRYDPVTDYFATMMADGTPMTFYVPDPTKHRKPTNLDCFLDLKAKQS